MFVRVSTDLEDLNFDQFLKTGFVFQPPGEKYLWLGVTKKSSKEDHCFFHSNFYHTEQFFFQSDCVFKIEIKKLSLYLKDRFSELTKIKYLSNTDIIYNEDVKNTLTEFKLQTDLKKLVCVTKADYSLNNIHPISRFDSLVKLEGSLFGIWGMEIQNVLGVSPEPLLIKRSNHFETIALAGTISTSIVDFEKVLLSDDKEIEEQNLVVKDIISKIEDCSTKIKVGDVCIRRFGEMAHLETKINFISNLGTLSLVEKLSPTAALGGYPTALAKSELQKHKYFYNEKLARSFGGVYGLKGSELEVALVGIRNIYWSEGDAQIHSGSGIVSSSDPNKEVLEVQRKRQSIEGIFSE